MILKKLLLIAISVFSIVSINAMDKPKRLRTRKTDGNYEKTILSHAISNNKKAIKECLKQGASIDFQGVSNGNTLLHSALFLEKIDLIEWLLARGARTDLKDNFVRFTVLDYINESNYSAEIRNIFTPANITRLKDERFARKQEKLKKQEPFKARLRDYAQAHPENPLLHDLSTLASLRNEKR